VGGIVLVRRCIAAGSPPPVPQPRGVSPLNLRHRERIKLRGIAEKILIFPKRIIFMISVRFLYDALHIILVFSVTRKNFAFYKIVSKISGESKKWFADPIFPTEKK